MARVRERPRVVHVEDPQAIPPGEHPMPERREEACVSIVPLPASALASIVSSLVGGAGFRPEQSRPGRATATLTAAGRAPRRVVLAWKPSAHRPDETLLAWIVEDLAGSPSQLARAHAVELRAGLQAALDRWRRAAVAAGKGSEPSPRADTKSGARPPAVARATAARKPAGTKAPARAPARRPAPRVVPLPASTSPGASSIGQRLGPKQFVAVVGFADPVDTHELIGVIIDGLERIVATSIWDPSVERAGSVWAVTKDVKRHPTLIGALVFEASYRYTLPVENGVVRLGCVVEDLGWDQPGGGVTTPGSAYVIRVTLNLNDNDHWVVGPAAEAAVARVLTVAEQALGEAYDLPSPGIWQLTRGSWVSSEAR